MSEPLYLLVEQSFVGEKRLIVETLDALADLLKREIVAHERTEKPNPTPVDASTYLEIITAQSGRLAKTFSTAGPTFQAAVEAGGPEDYSNAYGSFLGDLQAANDAISAAQAPVALKSTEEAYKGLIRAMLDQVRSWPQKLRDAAGQVQGDGFDVKLEVNVKIAPYERALSADTKALGL
jgi:hypothetical protein